MTDEEPTIERVEGAILPGFLTTAPTVWVGHWRGLTFTGPTRQSVELQLLRVAQRRQAENEP